MSESTTRPTATTLLRLAWPIVISRASQVVVGLSDVLFVADLGTTAVAATSTGATNAFSLFILPMGVCFIISSFASQLYGRGEAASARRFAWYGLLVGAVTQLLAMASTQAVDPILQLLYADDVRQLMSSYLTVRLMGSGAVIGIEAMGNYYGGLGRTRPAMLTNVVAMSLNIVLNWVLIGGHLGAPELGVYGAALASSIATWTAFAGFFLWFLAEGRGLPRAGFVLEEFQRVLRFGLPTGLNWFFEYFAFVFFINVVVAGLGTPALAAMNAVITLNSAAFMPAFALASAGAILVGQAIGAQVRDDVGRIVKMTMLMAMAWEGTVGLLYLGIPQVLMAPFAKGEGALEMATIGARMLVVSAAWQLFDAAASTLAETLRAAGDTLFPLVARLAIAWAVFVPGSYLTVRAGGGEVAATFWLVAYLGLLALTLFLRYRAGVWRRIELVR